MPGRVGDPRLRRGGQRVDDVAPVGRQAERVEVLERGLAYWPAIRATLITGIDEP